MHLVVTGCQGAEISNVAITAPEDSPNTDGHGISVGSLGQDKSYSAMEQIYVWNCTFWKTSNCARIKTWQGGSGNARGITFPDIILNEVEKAIVINKYYCNDDNNFENNTSAVKVSDVWFTDFQGSSSLEVAVEIFCSKTVACTDIHLDNVQLMNVDTKKGLLDASC
ncbi:hypothetical protein GIB67_000838 [Kingdonia uniflora]|uniref:Polygalacturonase n=1 Tax=Kingdonia uniflora TaxID=39325 RepID=A0A7J7NQU0_9MAGN|nr:hypothetical protein GIB67_000838 [Kingdonia uniflora]